MRTELETVLASTYDGLKRDEIRMEPVVVDTVANTGTWKVEVQYVEFPPLSWPSTGESSFSFDTGGGTQHVTQSRSTISRTAASGTAPDFKGAINVSKDSVNGVDITVPVYNFAETHYIDDNDVTQVYKVTLFNLTGKMNSGAFRGFAAGEVLFLGASGARRGFGDWEITFRFAGSPNVSNLTIGDITGIDPDIQAALAAGSRQLPDIALVDMNADATMAEIPPDVLELFVAVGRVQLETEIAAASCAALYALAAHS